MQGFVFMSFILIWLFNTRFHSHLVSFHFFFFNKKKKKKIMQFHICPSVVFTDIRLKMWTKNSQANRSLRENVSVFLSHLLAIISRNVGTKGHLKKEIILLKYQFFRFMTKSGGQFELLNWLEKSTRLLELKLKLELKLEDYDIVHFTIP